MFAAGIHATGQVVGWSGRRIDERVVVWTAGRGMVDLRSLAGVYTGGSTMIDTGNRATRTRAHPFLA
jgi:probable HAF family extracellular repeat protein